MPKPWDDDPNQIFDPSEHWFLSSEKPKPESPPAGPLAEASKPWSDEVFLCPVCQGHNPLGHQFCGHCGVHMQLSPAQAYQFNARSEPAVQPPPPITAPSSAFHDDQLEFLRLRAFAEDENTDGSSRRWLLLIGALAMVLVGFLAYQYFEQPISRTATSTTQAQPAPVPPPPAETPAAAPVEAAEPSPSPSDDRAAAPSAAAPAKTEEGNAPEPDTSAAQKVQTRQSETTVLPASNRSAVSFAEDGEQELAYAERYLSGTAAQRNPSAAAQWLWKAVSKQNTHAVLLLSDLYMSGEGVPKSCEQARLLLTTAAKKGEAEAVQKLRHVNSQSCK